MQAIPTEYANNKFRSRLEARWAIFLQTLGIDFAYEAERYSLPSASYLPDFWLPSLRIFIEVKPLEGYIDQSGIYNELVCLSGFSLLRISGGPYFGEYSIRLYSPPQLILDYGNFHQAKFAEGRGKNGQLYLVEGENYVRLRNLQCQRKAACLPPMTYSEWISQAMRAASAARF